MATDIDTIKTWPELEEHFADKFMQPDASRGYWVVDFDNGDTEYFPLEFSDRGTRADFADYIESQGKIETVTKNKAGYIWRLSAPGYLDCTNWSISDTMADLINDILDMYGDE